MIVPLNYTEQPPALPFRTNIVLVLVANNTNVRLVLILATPFVSVWFSTSLVSSQSVQIDLLQDWERLTSS